VSRCSTGLYDHIDADPGHLETDRCAQGHPIATLSQQTGPLLSNEV
jgi:hypothetical protein